MELEQLQEAWRRTILPAVEQRSIPIGQTLGEAHPAALAGDTLTLEFPPTAAFHLRVAEDPKNAAMLRDALYEVTGRKLAVAFELGEAGHASRGGRDAGERGRRSRTDEEHLRREGAGRMSFDLNALMKQAQEMQAQMAQVQEEASKETAEASAGGGMVTVVASATGEIKELRIDPKAIDPDDPGAARRSRHGRRERSAARGARQGRGEDEEHAAARSRRPAARGSSGIDENFVAKLLDVGSELSFPAGHVVVDPDNPMNGLLLVLQGVLAVESPAGDGRTRARAT